MSLLLCRSGYGAKKDSSISPSTPSTTPSYSAECHSKFESLRFILIPDDIQFFIDFERQDYERRRHEVETSDILPQREVPTPGMYRAYQNGLIGGRYQSVFFKESPHLGLGLEEFATPKERPGCPIIVFRRAFQMFGSLYLDSLEIETRLQLEELLNLYVTNDNELRASSRGRQEASAEEQYADYYQHSTNIPENPNGLSHENAGWALGPESTTKDVVHRYSSTYPPGKEKTHHLMVDQRIACVPVLVYPFACSVT